MNYIYLGFNNNPNNFNMSNPGWSYNQQKFNMNNNMNTNMNTNMNMNMNNKMRFNSSINNANSYNNNFNYGAITNSTKYNKKADVFNKK